MSTVAVIDFITAQLFNASLLIFLAVAGFEAGYLYCNISSNQEVLLGKNTRSNMLKTCFAKSDRDTPIRDLFPISTVEKRRQEEVDIPSSVHMLDQFSALPQKKKKWDLLLIFSRCNWPTTSLKSDHLWHDVLVGLMYARSGALQCTQETQRAMTFDIRREQSDWWMDFFVTCHGTWEWLKR